jgi:pectate lyase
VWSFDVRSLLALAVALALTACGSDVAQTAVRPNEKVPFDCRATSGDVVLPSDPALGGGDTLTDSPLLGDGYGAGEGPGIAIVARDGFRLYQNGELVAESTRSLEPVFVPLTFLPGENVVSVVASSPNRAPAILAHIDELERPYVSDASWKVSTTPSDDFRRPGYDDSGWDDALDHGLALATPDCSPPPGFVAGSAAHWIGPRDGGARTAVFRLSFRIVPLGHGRATTGGGETSPVVARSVDELVALLTSEEPAVILVPEARFDAPETVFDARRTGADVQTFEACPVRCNDGSGMITYTAMPSDVVCPEPTTPMTRDERNESLGSNKTLVGLGRGAMLRGLWLSIEQAENVVFRNLVFFDVNPETIETGDGVSIGGASRIWLDHLTFRWIGDGFLDVGNATDATFSWLHFDGRSEFACAGRHPRANELSASVATIHHSFYDRVLGRAPAVNGSVASVHLLNNVVFDDPDYGVAANCGAEVVVEGSSFESVAFPTVRRECADDATIVGAILARDNAYDATGPHQRLGVDSPEPRDAVPPPPYDYPVDDANDVRFTVRERAGAGSLWAQPFELD